MSDRVQQFKPALPPLEFSSHHISQLLTSDREHKWILSSSEIDLPPYGVFIGRLK
jgi:hypothetical protein